MRDVSPLIFALAVLVNSIACGNFCCNRKKPDYFNGIRVIRLTKSQLFGAYFKPDERRKEVYPVADYLDVVVKGDLIIGRQYHREMRPICDEHGNFVEKEISARTWTIIDPKLYEEKGLYSELPSDPNIYECPCYPWTSPSTSRSSSKSRH